MSNFDINNILLSCEVELTNSNNFNVIVETLERIGSLNKRIKTLFQSCHILHKMNKFYIVHYKEMYALDGKNYKMNYQDLAVRNLIAKILENWKLIKIKTPHYERKEPIADMKSIVIIPFKERKNWNIKAKYIFGCYRRKWMSEDE